MATRNFTLVEVVSALLIVIVALAIIGWAVNQSVAQAPVTMPAIISATIPDTVRVVPEMIFAIKPNYIICSDKISLKEISAHMAAGEKTLANLMLFQNGGACAQSQENVGNEKLIADNSKWKVLSVDSNIVEFTFVKPDDIPPIALLLGTSFFWAPIEIVNPASSAQLVPEHVPPLQSNDSAKQEQAAWKATLTTAPPEVRTLLLKENALNETCRGGSGDDPRTMQACDQRDIIFEALKAHGWCWGNDNPTQPESDKLWQACEAH